MNTLFYQILIENDPWVGLECKFFYVIRMKSVRIRPATQLFLVMIRGLDLSASFFVIRMKSVRIRPATQLFLVSLTSITYFE